MSVSIRTAKDRKACKGFLRHYRSTPSRIDIYYGARRSVTLQRIGRSVRGHIENCRWWAIEARARMLGSWTRVLRFLRRVMSEATGHDSVRGAKVAIIKLERGIVLDRNVASCGTRKLLKSLWPGTGVAGVGNVLEGQSSTRCHSSGPRLGLSTVQGVTPGLISFRHFVICNLGAPSPTATWGE